LNLHLLPQLLLGCQTNALGKTKQNPS
jgi:hypothetical protein